MLMTMEPEMQQNLESLHAYEMLRELKTLFAQQAEQELLQTTRDFHSCRQEEGQSVSSYVLKMKGYIDNLERLGYLVTLGLGTVNELHVMLKLHEQTLTKSNAPDLHAIRASKVQKGNKHKKSQSQTTARGQNHRKGKNKQAYAPKPKIPLPPKWENPAKDSICHEYGEIGHWKRNCPQYLAELMKKKKNAASGAGCSGIFVIELNNILNRSWIYDTGCDPESEKWLNAMNVEMQSMKDNEVWVLVELPSNSKTVGSKWLFKKKTDMDGNVHIYKARLVAKGYTQTLGIDYEKTFSPDADIRAIRILIAIAAYYDYEIWQLDIKTAFLNGYLNEEVYMEQPEGFVNPKYPNRVCNLKRSIYGLKQASSIPMLQSVKTYLEKCFAMKDLGSIMYAVRCTHPDVAFAQNVTSRFQQNLGDIHWTTVKNILKYLRNTKDM
nr:zinc finger, CCHC-type [Tanacetum cinerariifolium]